MIDIEDPNHNIYSATNNFNFNPMMSLIILDDNSINIVITSTIAGVFQIKSNLFLGNSKIFYFIFEVKYVTKILNSQFRYQTNVLIKTRLEVSFNLADDYDNLMHFDEYFQRKLFVILQNDDVFNDHIILTPSKKNSNNSYSYR